jgi:hypothetical protein
MGVKLFGVDIAKIVAQKIGPGLLDCTLTRVTGTTREPGNLAGGTQPVTATYPCKGFEAALEQRHIDGTLVKRTDVMVVLLGDTISGGAIEPRAGDRVQVAGGVTRAVVTIVDRDAAAATFSLAVR